MFFKFFKCYDKFLFKRILHHNEMMWCTLWKNF